MEKKIPLCGCGCGECTTWNKFSESWNKFINGHQNRTEKYWNTLEELRNPKLCECGCGGEVHVGRRFISGHNSFGHKCSEETKMKIGIANKGNNWNLGRKHTEESKEKMSIALRGRKLSKENKRKLSIANKGKKLSEETKIKIGNAGRGKKHTEESKRKMSKIKKGKVLTQSTIDKISITKLEKRQKLGITTTAKGYCNVWDDKEYVEDLRGSACVHCGITNMMSIKLSGCKLHTHHKNGKENCAPEDIWTLCVSCHMRLHSILRWNKYREDKLNGKS